MDLPELHQVIGQLRQIIDQLHYIIGEKGNITAWQMSIRAIFIFIYGLLLLRIAGRRIFQRSAALDIILAVLIGSNLSRALTGNAPFLPTLAATTVLVVVYWILAYAAFCWSWVGWLVKGRTTQLVADGRIDWRPMRRYGLTKRELDEAMREEGIDALERVKAAYMERDGHISFIRREQARP